ncbi:MAG TPA: hypothetical protein VJB57_14200 [Dehalococcoidia bacterium]|nr:hypothetical protein [Dehalococcoidia bacterium]
MTSERRTQLDLTGLLSGLEQPLELIDSPQRKQELTAYVNAARRHVERAAFDLLSDVVAAFNDGARERRARLEYAAGSLELVVEPISEPVNDTGSGPTFSDTDQERVTLRLPKELKDLIDGLASRHGISANNWYVQELSRVIRRNVNEAMRDEMRGGRRGYRGRSSMKGFVGGDAGP